MKLIFLMLLVGNLAFFLLQFMGKSPMTETQSEATEYKNFGNLRTISERDSELGTKERKKRIPEPAVASASGLDAVEKCELIGPFAELLHAEYLVERLNALSVPSVIKQVEVADGQNYWVYLKPEMSEKEAMRRLSEIQQAKAIDSYIIPSGELANGISFGQFTSEKEAINKAEQIRGQGYAAEIKEVLKSHNETWVEVHDEVEQKISEEKWLELLKDEKAIERRQNYCLGVAH